jgi:hypothetical protein
MDQSELVDSVKKIDLRLERIEQFLPTLATKEELRAQALATKEELRAQALATKEDLRAAVALLATKEELRAAVALLATKEELRAAVAPLATRAELREESERTRRHSQVLFESLRDDIRIVAEAQVSTLVELRSMSQQHRKTLDNHELRLVRLESDTRPGR